MFCFVDKELELQIKDGHQLYYIFMDNTVARLWPWNVNLLWKNGMYGVLRFREKLATR